MSSKKNDQGSLERVEHMLDYLADMLEDAERRGTRMETRLCKLMYKNGLDANGDTLTAENERNHHEV